MISASQARELTPGIKYEAFAELIEKRIRDAAARGQSSCYIYADDLRGPQIKNYAVGQISDGDPCHVVRLVNELKRNGYSCQSIPSSSNYRDFEDSRIKVSWE
jgi:hypothetical protein